jgi:hypothetical protein
MHMPDIPAPMIATFSARFGVMTTTSPLAGLRKQYGRRDWRRNQNVQVRIFLCARSTEPVSGYPQLDVSPQPRPSAFSVSFTPDEIERMYDSWLDTRFDTGALQSADDAVAVRGRRYASLRNA